MLNWLTQQVLDGATRLQVMIMVTAAVGVLYLWFGLIKEGLDTSKGDVE